ncbi:MAG TPA: DUF2760 domain-containing protein [Polyangiaceae bacterium]|nr:DUF2760 domain-containing protein [Polyangiaceae bacterium]
MSDETLSFFDRVWLAWACFFRVLFDPGFAGRVVAARAPSLPVAEASAPVAKPSAEPALQLLALFQRQGRLVDFLQQDIAAFSDADVGAAARVVHEGCRRALRDHADVEALRPEAEGARVTVDKGFDPSAVKLVGDVGGEPPYAGVLRHRGWRAKDLRLPQVLSGHDAGVLAPAEVELG